MPQPPLLGDVQVGGVETAVERQFAPAGEFVDVVMDSDQAAGEGT